MANRLKIRNGTAAPSGAIGIVGEPFVDTTNKNFYISDSGTVASQGSTFVHVGGATYTARVDESLVAAATTTSGEVTILSRTDVSGGGSITWKLADTASTSTYTWPSALPGGNTVLQSDASGNLSWVTQTAGYSQWNLTADSGTQQAIANNEVVTIAGGLNVTTTVGATDTVTVALDQVLVDSNGASVLDVTGGTATAVNYIDINNAATGTGPEIAAVGTDTNIDLELLSKGTGVVTANGVEVVTTTGTQTLTNKTLTSPVFNTGVSGTAFLDDDTFASATASTLASSESIKTYVDNEIAGVDLTFDTAGDTGTGAVATSGTLTVSGTTNEIETNATGATITVGLPDNVTVAGNLAVNGTTISTDETTGTFALLNTTLTGGINFGQAVTGTINIGSGTSTVVTGNDLTVTGDLTVQGDTTTVNTQNVLVEDQNIVLGNVGSPTDTTANTGGITLLGATNKTITWVQTTTAWTLSEHLDLAADKEYRMNNVAVLDYDGSGNRILDNVIVDGGTY
jgi:hypothetical protein